MVSDMLRVLMIRYYRFPDEYASERIFKISQYLAKI